METAKSPVMSISRLSSSSAYNYAAQTPSASSANKPSAAAPSEQSGLPQGMDELMKLVQQLVKALGKDGFEDPSSKGAGGPGAGGAGNGGGGAPGVGGGGGGESAPGVGGGQGPGGLDASGGGLTPPELGGESSPSGASPSASAGKAGEVAQKIAQDATSWNYDRSAGKSFDEAVSNENNFDGSKSGICTDMAVEAAQRFEAAGVDARLVGGETNKGNHAWVEYKGDDGQWKRFDPTAAATSKDANAAINTDTNAYQYGRVIETRDDVPAEVPSI